MSEGSANKASEVVLIIVIVGFMAALAMLIPQARQFVFGNGGGGGGVQRGADNAVYDPVRNKFPMAQYTQLFKKHRFATLENGYKRVQQYYFSAPAKMAQGVRYPLVVVLHDKAGMAYAPVYLRERRVSTDFPAFIVVPQAAPTKVWSSPKKYSGQEFTGAAKAPISENYAMPDVLDIVATLMDTYPVDPSRLYIVGCDEGGAGVYGTAQYHPGIFAAGVVMNGMWSYLDAAKLTKMPLLVLQGDEDKVYDPGFARTMSRAMKSAGAPVDYSELQGVSHECSDSRLYIHSVWKWLFSKQRQMPAPDPEPQLAQP
ncbi:MAG: dienelactone hydrolase family protein [Alphaproteobacteria bacterium]